MISKIILTFFFFITGNLDIIEASGVSTMIAHNGKNITENILACTSIYRNIQTYE